MEKWANVEKKTKSFMLFNYEWLFLVDLCYEKSMLNYLSLEEAFRGFGVSFFFSFSSTGFII